MNTGFFDRLQRAFVWPVLLMAWLACGFEARANPTGGSVNPNQATITGQGTPTVNINQTAGSALINWSTFNVGAGETVNFNQPSANSVTWNQINDANPSQILGDINANGYVVLQNANGFYIGGQAVLTTHGLVMTTASTPAINPGAGGPWSFDAPPPAAKIENYGQINITGGGTAYLIASDIVNEKGGSINAPNGQIGLYDGETVLVSTAPNGQGLNAAITLPQGSVDNEGKLTASGGSVVAQAQFVNQNGVIQADTVANVNGTIELLGGSSVTLGANSTISAAGDSTASGASAGGSAQIQGNSFSDAVGSSINVSGASQGGNAGSVSISAPQMTALNSTINGQAAAGYLNGTLTIDTADIVLNSDGSPVSGALGLDVAALSSGLSQINLLASDNIMLASGAQWLVGPNGGIPTALSMVAGNEIELQNGSAIQANGGNINLNAPFVDQGGTLQANSVGSANGVIEIDASQKLTLEASSTVSANGDSSASSPGGFVVLNAGGLYTDYSGSTISVSGNAGGQGGVVEIFDPQAGSTPLQTAVSGALAWLVNPFDMTLSGNSTGTTYDDNGNLDANFNLSDLAAYSQIDLHALDNIELQAPWTLNGSTGPAVLSLTAGNNIILDGGNGAVPNYGINAGKNWNVNLTAGTGFTPTSAHPTPVSGSAGIYLEANSVGQSYILAQNGNINLWAANEVQVGWVDYAGSGVENPTSGSLNPGASSISTTAGGNISVKTLHGDVNTGSNPNGFTYNATAPYDTVVDTVANLLGGISTAAGGNVAIAAGGNVISYIPSGTTLSTSDAAARDGGTGAFGSLPGNVTITAGGNIYGHFVVADGVGTITAGRDAGLAGTADFALSLISGGWSINAPNGSIYLQEVRNPNGVFNDSAPHGRSGNPGKYFFNYSQDAYVDLTANAVYLTDMNLPRYSSSSPDIPGVLYPPILDINAGSGGVTLEGNITLFPSADQNLNITTTDEGSVSGSGGLADPFELLMSDSAATVWSTGAFLDSDHGALANEPNDSTPVTINVSGNIQDLNLIVDKVAQINVDGDLINSGFSGQNLQASDITSIKVGGVIYSSSPYSSIDLTKLIPEIPAEDLEDLLPGMANSWNAIFALAIDASALNSSTELQTLANTQASQWLTTILENPDISLFQDQQVNGSLTPSIVPNFIYSPTTLRLWYVGQMSSQIAQALENPITILHLVNGQPVIDTNPNDDSPGRTFGQVESDTINWVPTSQITQLASEAGNAVPLSTVQLGYRIGGPGQFDITADAISLGASDGIISGGLYDPAGGYGRYGNLTSVTTVGATINVLVTGSEQLTDPLLPAGPDNPYIPSLDMLSSTIASLDGGDVKVVNSGGSMDLGSSELIGSTGDVGSGSQTATHLTFGIYTTGGGGVNVTSQGDIDVGGSRIATYDGGDIFVESLTGDVNIGSGSSDLNTIYLVYNGEPDSDGESSPYAEDAFGSGIQAKTPVPPYVGEAFPADAATAPGNITVETPEGDIIATTAGIIQEALDGSIAPGPTVTLTAGTFPSGTPGQPGYIPGFVGNIDLGNSGVIGGTVNLSANGNINGEIISRQNSTVNAAQSFSGTLLAGGSADVSGGGTVSGTIVGVGGANVSGSGGVTASVLGQNVSVNGGAATSTLGSSATATASTQSAAQQANSQSQQQVTADQGEQGNEKKKKETQIRKVGHVSVLLSSADRK